MIDSQAKLFAGIKSKAAKTGVCIGCNRPIKSGEKHAFEEYVSACWPPAPAISSEVSHENYQVDSQIIKARVGPSDKRMKALADELEGWKEEAAKLRKLIPVQENAVKLREKALPELREQLRASQDKVEDAAEQVEKVSPLLVIRVLELIWLSTSGKRYASQAQSCRSRYYSVARYRCNRRPEPAGGGRYLQRDQQS
jgi:hypothetical protein